MAKHYSSEQFLSWAIAPRERMGLRGWLSIPVGKFTRWLYQISPKAAELFCRMFYFGLMERVYMRLFWSLRALDDPNIPDFKKMAMQSATEDIEALKADILAAHKSGNLRNLPQRMRRFRQLERFDRLLAKVESDLYLLDAGFNIPPKADAPTFAPDPDRALYLLHHSRPIHTNGYATRSHNVLAGLNAGARVTRGVTRLGYPQDRGPLFRETTFPDNDMIEGCRYQRLQSDEFGLHTLAMREYLQANIDAHHPIVAEVRPAVIHGASNYINGITASVLANLHGVVSLYEVRGLWEVTRESREPDYAETDDYTLNVKLETQACLAADHVVTITEALKAELVRRGVPGEKISVIPNGVDFARFQPREADMVLKTGLGFDEDDIVVGFVGSIVDYEGLSDLMEALAQLRRDGLRSLKALIVGDGAALEALRLEVSRLKLDDAVIFTGRVPHEDVEGFYSVIDIAPFPRRGLKVCEMVAPLKPFEAMAMGKPVIVSDVAAMSEFIEDGKTGLVCKKEDPRSLAEALRRLHDDPELRRRLGEEGRNFVGRERDWKILSDQFNALYDRLIATHLPD